MQSFLIVDQVLVHQMRYKAMACVADHAWVSWVSSQETRLVAEATESRERAPHGITAKLAPAVQKLKCRAEGLGLKACGVGHRRTNGFGFA